MAINRMDHAAIRVRDLGEGLAWYEGVLGLTVLDRNDNRALLACSGDAVDLTITAGGQSLDSFAMGVDNADDLDEVASRLKANEIAFERYTEPDRPGHDEIIGFTLPSGHKMEFAVGSGGRVAGKTEKASDGTYRPTDIDHINLLGEVSPAVITEFLTVVLGFKHTLKLTVAGQYAGTWLRATATDHDIAYMGAQRPSDRLHHIAFAVEDGNHYYRISDRLAETGHRWEFGPGRHLPFSGQLKTVATNNFAYTFDPTGNRNEFSSSMLDWPDDMVPVERDIAPDEVGAVMNGWANNMPESFMTIGS
jgi:catechol 2,3-dioxygenase